MFLENNSIRVSLAAKSITEFSIKYNDFDCLLLFLITQS